MKKLVKKGEDIVKWWGHRNGVEDIKLVKKFTDWKPTGVTTEGLNK